MARANGRAETVAVSRSSIVEAVAPRDRRGALERIANRMDGQGRTRNGSAAAALLGAVGGALMRLEA